MALQLDRSLYSKSFNAETRAAIDAVNAEAERVLPRDLFEGEWGCQNTLRKKQHYLAIHRRQP